VRRIGHVFETSYAAVDAQLPVLVAAHRPQILLMFGLAARTPFVRVETTAHNTHTALLADASGALPSQRAIDASATPRRHGRAPFARLVMAARGARVAARLSDNAGRYLCNYLYWRASEFMGDAAPRLLVFVHIPKVRRAARPQSADSHRPVTQRDLLRSGEAMLRTLLAATHR
jgi:pyroglutamyl-peptidase